ncbi:response regulator [Spirosoma fluviale]|uniref:histidine kinase n=1 Tax=Spirosoma fluviale TaxID=1597977 RepID=A0A286GCW6_9BACT|nr:response regulator [Spirosoma fluviale]SOD92844.1 Signal transduction histidine kinase [Spirosoma fluviale]
MAYSTTRSLWPIDLINFRQLLFLFFVLFLGTSIAEAGVQPLARRGTLDLRKVDLTDQTIELTGQWKWYWHQLRSPKQAESAAEYIDFPQQWSASTWQQQALPRQGFATYGLIILLPARHRPLSLKLPDQNTAYRLFVNGKELAHDGNPTTSAATTIPHWSTQLVSLPVSGDTLTLLLQLANYQHAKGGSTKAITIGESTKMASDLAIEQAMAVFMTGFVLMSGLFFLGLFAFSSMDRPMLYYGLFCLAYSYRLMGTDYYILHTLFPQIPWYISIRLEYGSLYLAIGLFVQYTQSLYPRDTHPVIIRAMAWLCFAFLGTVLLLPPMLFTHLMDAFLGLMVAYIGYAIYVYWMAFRRKRPGATYSLMSTGLLLTVFTLILIQYFGFVAPLQIELFAGYLGFFFLQSLVLAFRFTYALNEARYTEKQFLANMSHEIRTPLNAILGFSEMLEAAPLDKEQKESLHYIRTAGKNLLTIVNDILDIAKIEAGMLPLEIIPFSLGSLADSIRTMILPVATEKNLSLVVEIDPTLPAIVLGDPTRLTQILLNLLSNAVKFTQQGSVIARIVNVGETADSIRVRFSVQDTGIGMAPEVLPYIFERFRQANDFTTRYYGGTGLGLSIVKSLTEMQGGWVTVSSTLGQGSCFTLEIPYKPTANPQEPTVDLSVEPQLTATQNVRILVVEDNLINQKLAQQVLKRLGYTSQIVENGQEALDLLKVTNFDLILMDIQMPIMDGYTTTRYIRTTLQSSVPIIAMTAHALASEREQCLQAGMNDFIPKPFQLDELQRIMRKYTPSTLKATPAEPDKTAKRPVTSFALEPLLLSVDNDSAFAAEVLDLFLSQTSQELGQIKQAIAQNDNVTIARLVHTQKVPIRTFGLTQISQLIDTFEAQLAANNDPVQISSLIKQYVAAIEAELPAMQTALSNLQKDSVTD